MKNPRGLVPVLLVCLWGLPAAAPVQGPTFNCAKVQSEGEKQTCGDESLAALDR